MTFNVLSDQLCDPSVNTTTFTQLLDTLLLNLLIRSAHYKYRCNTLYKINVSYILTEI